MSVWWSRSNYMSLLCVGEWSGQGRSSVVNIHWHQVGVSLVNRQWRSRVGRWRPTWSHSAAQQWATSRTCPHWQHRLSIQAAAAIAVMLQRTHVTTVRCRRQWFSLNLVIQSALSNSLIITVDFCSTLSFIAMCLVQLESQFWYLLFRSVMMPLTRYKQHLPLPVNEI